METSVLISIFSLKIYICSLKIHICNLKICIFNLKIELFLEDQELLAGPSEVSPKRIRFPFRLFRKREPFSARAGIRIPKISLIFARI